MYFKRKKSHILETRIYGNIIIENDTDRYLLQKCLFHTKSIEVQSLVFNDDNSINICFCMVWSLSLFDVFFISK